MADYPDYFELIQVVGADIMVPIDVQGAYIMMPVDIQAQYLTLEIDIVAQTVGNISIDLAAQTIGDLAVNISAQDLAQLTIDIDAQSVGVYLQPSWAALEGEDKNFTAYNLNLVKRDGAMGQYVVPDGKALHITHVTGWSAAAVDADLDKNQIMGVLVRDDTAGTDLFAAGGNGGCVANLSKPIVIPENHTAKYWAYNHANHNCASRISVAGYEV